MARMTWVAAVAALAVAAAVMNGVDAKRCVFLHGAGVTDTGPTTSTFPDYWGNVDQYVPQCSETVFAHQDTVTRRFDDPDLMQAYCDAAGADANGIVSDAIIFTHSLGNAAFAAALRSELCQLDAGSSTWYEVSGPMHGSAAANAAAKFCSSQSILEDPLKWLGEELHYCADDDTLNLSYVSMETTDSGLVGLAEYMMNYINGSMCGTSAFGLTSKYSLGLEAVAALANFGEPNDGMVAISSCELFPSTADYTANFYVAEINHADATCRNGNGDFGDAARQPCSWYSYRT